MKDFSLNPYFLIRAIVNSGRCNDFEIETALEDRSVMIGILELPPFDQNNLEIVLEYYEADRLVKNASKIFKGGYRDSTAKEKQAQKIAVLTRKEISDIICGDSNYDDSLLSAMRDEVLLRLIEEDEKNGIVSTMLETR